MGRETRVSGCYYAFPEACCQPTKRWRGRGRWCDKWVVDDRVRWLLPCARARGDTCACMGSPRVARPSRKDGWTRVQEWAGLCGHASPASVTPFYRRFGDEETRACLVPL
jgi:hypothetical protein